MKKVVQLQINNGLDNEIRVVFKAVLFPTGHWVNKMEYLPDQIKKQKCMSNITVTGLKILTGQSGARHKIYTRLPADIMPTIHYDLCHVDQVHLPISTVTFIDRIYSLQVVCSQRAFISERLGPCD